MPRVEGQRVGTKPDGTPVWAPVLVVDLYCDRGSVSGPAVVDSGADHTVVPFEAIAPTGYKWTDLPKGKSGIGAGGPYEIRELAGRVQYREWVVCEGLHVAEPGRLPVILLGREDFFARFVVKFTWHKQPPYVDIDPVVVDPARRGARQRGR